MTVFSKRNSTKNEHSGYEEASIGLRNRLLSLYGLPYSGDEHRFGVGNDNWIHERAFDKDLQMHFGNKIPKDAFKDPSKTSYDEVFDFIELYYERALTDLDSLKRRQLHSAISQAFFNSGSVYDFDNNGHVTLRIDDNIAKNISTLNNILSPLGESQLKFNKVTEGLINRSIDSADAVGDIFIVFEDYCKKITNSNSLEKALNVISSKMLLHPVQISIIEKLKGYGSDVWGARHAGNSPKPSEAEAMWYLEVAMSLIKYLDIKATKTSKLQ